MYNTHTLDQEVVNIISICIPYVGVAKFVRLLCINLENHMYGYIIAVEDLTMPLSPLGRPIRQNTKRY